MVITATNGGYTTTPNHRQNRRRERPGTRTRRTITRKAALQTEFAEGLIDAFDLDVRLPSDRSNPSPLLRQNFDNAWQKWKAKEAEQEVERQERERELEAELERAQLRLFGGEVDDDELRRLGILYNEDTPMSPNSFSNSISSSLPATKSPPLYTVRQVPTKTSRRQSTWATLPLNLSLSSLRDDYNIARLLSSIEIPKPLDQAQFPDVNQQLRQTRTEECTSTPQSLPDSSAFPTPVLVTSPTVSVNESSISLSQIDSIPSLSLPHEDWTFITIPSSLAQQQFTHPSIASTPVSEPDTWSLLSDDLE